MGRVAACEYVVEREGSHWTVTNQGRHFGRFAARRDALRSAAADAARVRRLGHHAAVLVRRQDGSLRTVPAHGSLGCPKAVGFGGPAPRPTT